MLEYSSIAELCRAAEQAGSTISQTALADQAEQMEQPADVLYQRMADSLGVMRDAVGGPLHCHPGHCHGGFSRCAGRLYYDRASLPVHGVRT